MLLMDKCDKCPEHTLINIRYFAGLRRLQKNAWLSAAFSAMKDFVLNDVCFCIFQD